MIGLTQAIFSYAVANILDIDKQFAVLGSLIPGLSMILVYSGPLQYEGVLLSLTSAIFFSALVYFGFNEEKSKSTFTGYSCSLLLESLTFSYLPILYPVTGFQGLGLFSSFDPLFNFGVVSVSIALMIGDSLKT